MANSPRLQPVQRLRIGAVNYLNTKPLVYGLSGRLPSADITYDLPSRLADQLDAGELDVALVPSIELASHSAWTIVSDACIGCQGPVLSVKVMFRVPPEKVRTLALDEGSRTSAALAQILLQRIHDVRPVLTSLPIGDSLADSDADAVLVIGDRAICNDDRLFVEVWDLGERWCQWANLPFVFAMWVARTDWLDCHQEEQAELTTALTTARDEGRQNLEAIACERSHAMDLPKALVYEYLHRNLYFYLDAQQRQGLALFYQQAAAIGLISTVPKVFFDDCSTRSL